MNLPKNYYAVLDGRKVRPLHFRDELKEWSLFFERGNRSVGNNTVGGAQVSTVFLGINHGYGNKEVWFETMIFGGDHNDWQRRYSTYEEALNGHQTTVARLEKGEAP